MNKISVAIITKNEEINIRRCIESVKWADEIVVADSGSEDNTVNICNECGCKVIKTKWLGFAKTKQLAVNNCKNEWVLLLDADEEVSLDLKNKIDDINSNKDLDAYKIKRKSYYLGRLIKHSGWNKDYPLRLFRKDKGSFDSKLVHEEFVINNKSKTAVIKEPVFHYPYPDISTHINKINQYTTLGAKQDYLNHRKSSILRAIVSAKLKFIKMYVLKLGFLDKKEGFILAAISCIGVFVKYIKLRQMQIDGR